MEKVIKKHLNSQKYAWDGVKAAFRTELNFRLELLIAGVVLLISWICGLDFFEWALVVISIFSVLGAELFNSALEYLADALIEEEHRLIKLSKDIGAASVLAAAIQAIMLGVIVVLHYLVRHGLCCG